MTALATILISSKYEDVVAISAHQLVEKAGHSKFTLQQLVERELDILKILKFQVTTHSSIFHEAMILSRTHQDKVLALCPDFKTTVFLEGFKYLSYLSYIATFSLAMQSYNVRLVAHALH